MPSIVDKMNSLSLEMESLLDFIAANKTLGDDFELYVEENEIKIEKQAQLNVALVEYLLDGKMQDGTRVLDYYTAKGGQKNAEVVEALKNSVTSVFEIKKVQKNAYETYSLTSEADFTLIPLVKMVNLRGISRGDFIRARAIELEGEFYLLEIYDVISSLNFYRAGSEAMKCLISNPKCAIFKNEAKKKKLKASIKDLKVTFDERFCDFDKHKIITTNKLADNLINALDEDCEISQYIEEPKEYKFFSIKEFEREGDFIKNAIGGFSRHECVYDVGLYMDEKEGLYIIPFMGTFYKIFETGSMVNGGTGTAISGESCEKSCDDTCTEFKIEGEKECIKEFLKSDKVPKSLILLAAKKYKNFLNVINSALETDFKSTSELVQKFKGTDDEIKFSPVVVLFNSKIFTDIMGFEEETPKNTAVVGRNEPCSCGSGKKYKHCCMPK